MPEHYKEAADYILPLYMNGLSGRMLRAPSTTKRQREILIIYGHHAMLERWWSLVENLRTYGHVTMPDLPGFGGMESFYKIGIKPDIDAYADYLAAFVKLRYKRKRVSLYAISFGFVVVTRMLQRYPELAKKVDLLIAAVGFVHNDDFQWSWRRRFVFRLGSRFFATRPVAIIIRYGALNRPVIKFLTTHLSHSKHRFIEVTQAEFEETLNFEVLLWQANDVRTHWLTTNQFLSLDNTKVHVGLPIIHIVSKGDHYFNNTVVEQHMRQVFMDYQKFTSTSKAHTPHVAADKSATAVMVPPGLRRLLAKKPQQLKV
jgi:pimeloyl-ACP methyl ester carboxylesterase